MTVDVGVRGNTDSHATSLAGTVCYACITHVPLLVEYPPFVKTIYLGEAQAPGRLNLRDLAPRWVPYHDMIGGLIGSFALRNYILAHQPETRQVGICHYRKFVTRYRIGQSGPDDHSVMDVITRHGVMESALADCMLPEDDKFLLVKPAHLTCNGAIQSYLAGYTNAHHVEDLLRFIAVAVELGVLDMHEVIPLFAETFFMVGGVELGVFPADFWLPTIGRLEEVTWACVNQHLTRREGAGQARLWGYCMERLSSFLLLKQLRTLGGEAALSGGHFGHLTLITEDGNYVPSV
jgi:hypothetical protein